MNSKTFRLLEKHQRLDAQLRLEQALRFPNLTRIRDLKKLKLKVKDALQALATRRRPMPIG